MALPKEKEMIPKDKYTTFNASSAGYRKSIHKVRRRSAPNMPYKQANPYGHDCEGSQIHTLDIEGESERFLMRCNIYTVNNTFCNASRSMYHRCNDRTVSLEARNARLD